MNSGLGQSDVVIGSFSRPGRWMQPKLNLDIYDYIMSLLDPDELVLMMRTCSTLRSAGIKYLVNWPGKLIGTETLRSFCQFVLQATPSRIGLLRTLSLDLAYATSRDRATLDPIIQVLSQAHNLRRLEMATGADMLLLNPDLVRVPYAMRSLRSLDLGQCGPEHADLLRTLQSPLEELKLTFMRLPWNLSRRSPSLLINFRDTLHTLSIYGYPLANEEPIVLPRVHSLETSFCDVSYDTTKMFAMFPNVTSMKFGDCSFLSLSMTDDEMDQVIKRNEALGLDHQWVHLRSLKGSAQVIHEAGLKCSVDDFQTCLDLEDAQCLIGLMPQLHVRTLNVELEFYQFMSDLSELADDHSELLYELVLSWSSVHKLDLWTQVDCGGSVDDIFDAFTKLPASSKIEQLSIEVTYNHPPDRDPDNASTVAKHFKSRDVQHYVTKIARALPALSNMTVLISCNSRSEWKIVRSTRKLAVICCLWDKDPQDWYNGNSCSDDESDEGSEDYQAMKAKFDEYWPDDIEDLFALDDFDY
ncbi:hypothetical protein CERSUDRAFT_96177 [Gelatoporia subvermispora B]|uniref:F-box domain-containing protein n=1 Tax=Ceriporiopsis subvermispora (strain B) TaxID=914234 RepID=M2RB08_CERS8|nr:hypothetical protein CERSUDRAFT_96177 [Gelatoporia subvermispora B]